MGLGALSLLSLLMWWSWLRSNPAFDWYALIARTPRLEPPWTPPALASAVGLRRLGRTALEGPPDCAIFSLASACRASAFCIASRVARFSFASISAASAFALLLRCVHLTLRCGIEHRTLRCCDAIACSFCAFHSARVRRCFFGPRRAIPQWIATWA